MKLLVLGGTRFLSRAVAGAAVAAGHDVTCACRGTGRLASGVRHLELDRSDGHAGLADAYDAVIDVARHPSWVRGALREVPTAHWVFVSSVSVYADDRTVLPAIDQDRDPMESPQTYGGMKVACERLVRAGSRTATIVRPGLVVGPEDPSGRFTYWPVRLARGGLVLAPGRPRDPVQVIDVRDLAEFLIRCGERQLEATLDAVGPPTRRADLLSEVVHAVGGEARLVWRDDEWLLAHEVEPWAGPRSLPLWVPGRVERDAGPVSAAGLVGRPLGETAADTLAWFRRTPGAALTGLTAAEERELLAL